MSTSRTCLIVGPVTPLARRVAVQLLNNGHLVTWIDAGVTDREPIDSFAPQTRIAHLNGAGWFLDFGLPGDTITRLAQRVSTIYLLFEGIPGGVPPLQWSNMAKEVVEFSRLCPKTPQVVLLSHLGLGQNSRRPLPESPLERPPLTRDAAKRALWQVERTLCQCLQNTSLQIIRTGPIVGPDQGTYPLWILLLSENDFLGESVHSPAFLTELAPLSQLLASLADDQGPAGVRHIGVPTGASWAALKTQVRQYVQSQTVAGFDLKGAAKRELIRMNFTPATYFGHNVGRAAVVTTETEKWIKRTRRPSPAPIRDLQGLLSVTLEQLTGFC